MKNILIGCFKFTFILVINTLIIYLGGAFMADSFNTTDFSNDSKITMIVIFMPIFIYWIFGICSSIIYGIHKNIFVEVPNNEK